MESLREFYNYLKWPVRYNTTTGYSWPILKKITGLYFMVFFGSMLLFIPISSMIGLEDMPHAINDMMGEMPLWQMAIIIVIGAPIIEEFMFRFPLLFRRPSLILGSTLLSVLFFFVAGHLTFEADVPLLEQNTGPAIIAAAIPLFGAFLYSFLTSLYSLLTFLNSRLTFQFSIPYAIRDISNKLDHDSYRWFPYIFYAVVILFAYAHASNFTGGENWYLLPLLVIPQFVLALLLGYVRMKNGMWANIYIHALNNSIPMFFLALASVMDLQL